MILSGGSSEISQLPELTPAKRKGLQVINVEEAVDQNSVTRAPCFNRVKKEKIHKSG